MGAGIAKRSILFAARRSYYTLQASGGTRRLLERTRNKRSNGRELPVICALHGGDIRSPQGEADREDLGTSELFRRGYFPRRGSRSSNRTFTAALLGFDRLPATRPPPSGVQCNVSVIERRLWRRSTRSPMVSLSSRGRLAPTPKIPTVRPVAAFPRDRTFNKGPLPNLRQAVAHREGYWASPSVTPPLHQAGPFLMAMGRAGSLNVERRACDSPAGDAAKQPRAGQSPTAPPISGSGVAFRCASRFALLRLG